MVPFHALTVARELHLIVAYCADGGCCETLVLEQPLETGLPFRGDGEDVVYLAEGLLDGAVGAMDRLVV